MSKKVLVTGGAGYIGSHCVIELIKEGYDVLIADNWVNSSKDCIKMLEKIVGRPLQTVNLDICDKKTMSELFQNNKFHAVLHLAALKSVGESVTIPLEYYRVNVAGTINLLECMKENNVKNLVFSSSSTVYGLPQYLPLDEKHPNVGDQISSPYGKTKHIVELILKDLYKSDNSWNIIMLRYFNPVGAHESGMIGEDPKGQPKNLMPYITQVAVGRLPEVKIFGNDFDTPDGTGVRDYIHISDLAKGHNAAMKKLQQNPGLKVYNLGCAKGISVLEMIQTFEKVSGRKIPYKVVERRQGDLACYFCDCSLAEKELDWKPEKSLEDMCKDAWNWQLKNPQGYSATESS